MSNAPSATPVPMIVTTIVLLSLMGPASTVAIIAVGMAAGDAKDALADQVRERVPGLVRRPLVEQTPGERLDQAVDALGGLQQDRPAVGTGLLLVEPAPRIFRA